MRRRYVFVLGWLLGLLMGCASTVPIEVKAPAAVKKTEPKPKLICRYLRHVTDEGISEVYGDTNPRHMTSDDLAATAIVHDHKEQIMMMCAPPPDVMKKKLGPMMEGYIQIGNRGGDEL